MAFGHGANERQAEPGATHVISGLDAHARKGFEESRQIRFGNALSLILDAYPPDILSLFYSTFDACLGRAVLDGVIDQIAQGAHQQRLITACVSNRQRRA
ncbi:hypothetical protein D3C71_1950410 [compost metagenome]